jgi:glucose-6-phosphate isomerase
MITLKIQKVTILIAKRVIDISQNLPVMLGLLGYYSTAICGHAARALLPYSQALLRFPAHIQQVDMESNGKSVTIEGMYFI